MISLNKNFVFIHVNKTGGTSVIEALARYEDPLHPDYDHANAKRMRRLIGPHLWDDMYSFAFLRNPFDRMVSSYFYRRQILEDTELSRPAKDKSFREWMLEDIAGASYASEWNDQLIMVEEGEGNIVVDDIFLFDYPLQVSFDIACGKIGIETPMLPHANKTKKNHWSTYYDADTQEVVEQRFSRDLAWAQKEHPGVWSKPSNFNLDLIS